MTFVLVMLLGLGIILIQSAVEDMSISDTVRSFFTNK